METIIMDGKASQKNAGPDEKRSSSIDSGRKTPGLCVILVGEDKQVKSMSAIKRNNPKQWA